MRGSAFAHVDNHPGDLGTDTHEEELDETDEIFFDEGERRIAEARRALAEGTLRHLRRLSPADPAGAPRGGAGGGALPGVTSASSRASTGSRPAFSDLAKVLVTGATGFIGSHVARLLVERGDEVRLGVEEGSPDAAIADLDCKRVKLRRARPALGAARAEGRRARVPLRGRHVGAAGRRGAAVRRERPRHEGRDGGVPAGRGGARGLHLERGGGRPGDERQGGRRDAALHRRPARHPVRELGARGRGGGDAAGRPGAAARVREPRHLPRGGRPAAVLDPARAELPARADPGIHRRRGRDRRRARRGGGAPACGHPRRGGRALHARRAQLHLRAPVRGPRPAVGRAHAGEASIRAPPRPLRRCWAPAVVPGP